MTSGVLVSSFPPREGDVPQSRSAELEEVRRTEGQSIVLSGAGRDVVIAARPTHFSPRLWARLHRTQGVGHSHRCEGARRLLGCRREPLRADPIGA